MKYLLTLCFDGAAYSGWQFQNNAPSVQGTLTAACGGLFGVPCSVTGCSRTDSGVHAVGFRATVSPAEGDFPTVIPPDSLPFALNARLPADISVTACTSVPDGFHPRYSAKGKTYRYLILNSRHRSPLYEGRAYLLKRELGADRIALMSSACPYFCGKNDYSAFMASGSSVKDTVRTVSDFSVECSDGLIIISVTADGFLYNMVRIMSGTLLDVGLGKIRPEDVPGIISSRSRSLAGPTLPAHGLYLYEVYY